MEVGRTNPETLWLGVRIERGLGNNAQAAALCAAPEERISVGRADQGIAGVRAEPGMKSRAAVQRMQRSPGRTTPGGLLRAERERRGHSVQYAAEDLHLDVLGDRGARSEPLRCARRSCVREGTPAEVRNAAGLVASDGAGSAMKRSAARRSSRRRFRLAIAAPVPQRSQHAEGAVMDRRCDCGRGRRRMADLPVRGR